MSWWRPYVCLASLSFHTENSMTIEDTPEQPEEEAAQEEDLKPKPPPPLAPRGIKTFTVCRQADETGISGTGIVIEGAIFATGQAIIHWLYPPPRGGIAIFDSLNDFLKVHVLPHKENKTIITFEDGEQQVYD